MLRAKYGEGIWSFHVLSGVPLSPHVYVFTNLETLQTQSFWGFVEASFT